MYSARSRFRQGSRENGQTSQSYQKNVVCKGPTPGTAPLLRVPETQATEQIHTGLSRGFSTTMLSSNPHSDIVRRGRLLVITHNVLGACNTTQPNSKGLRAHVLMLRPPYSPKVKQYSSVIQFLNCILFRSDRSLSCSFHGQIL